MSHQITLFGHRGTPNPPKIAILLEELGIKYEIIEKAQGDDPESLKHPNFTKINPNGRVPAIIDHTNNNKAVWESGAILLYLAERFDKSGKLAGANIDERAEVLEWLFFQMSGQGPSQGQANWFIFSHPIKDLDPSVLERYQNETKRIYGVMDKHLVNKDWFALNHLTVADIAFYPWVNVLSFAKVELSSFPNVEGWYKRMKALPSVERAYSEPKIAALSTAAKEAIAAAEAARH